MKYSERTIVATMTKEIVVCEGGEGDAVQVLGAMVLDETYRGNEITFAPKS